MCPRVCVVHKGVEGYLDRSVASATTDEATTGMGECVDGATRGDISVLEVVSLDCPNVRRRWRG